MILCKYDYKGFHTVVSVKGYCCHLRIYEVGDKGNKLVYERLVRGDVFRHHEIEEIVQTFVDKHLKRQELKKKKKEKER